MHVIEINSSESGAHCNQNSPWMTEVPDGWAVIPDDIKLPESFPFVDIEVKEVNGVKTVTKMIARNFPADDESINTQLEGTKREKITVSKTELAGYLASHPLQWTDGKYYSVTSEKQALLTSNLSLYQLAVSSGQNFPLKWNTTGDECTVWKYENLAALALAIGTYVQPFVSHQQELELAIKACITMEELDAIEIDYDPVLEQYLETVSNSAGLEEVVE